MANNFDEFPLFDDLIKPGTAKMSDIWVGIMSNFFQNLIGYLTQFGIMLPLLTSAQRDQIQSPSNGQMIYNTTVDAPQFYQTSSTSWRTISFT
jgi:hypothetical protein